MARFPFVLLPLVALLGACQSSTGNGTPYVPFTVVNGLSSFSAEVRVRIALAAPESSAFTANANGELGYSAPAGSDVCISVRRLDASSALTQTYALNVGNDPNSPIRIVVGQQNGLPAFTSTKPGTLNNGCS